MKRLYQLVLLFLFWLYSSHTFAQVNIDSVKIKFDSISFDSITVIYNSSLGKLQYIGGGPSNNPLTNCVSVTANMVFHGQPDSLSHLYDTTFKIGYQGFITKILDLNAVWDTLPRPTPPPVPRITMDSYSFDSCQVTDIKENKLDLNFLLYPNPATNQINLKYPEGIRVEGLTLYSGHGRLIQKYDGAQKTIRVNNLAPGIYFIVIHSEDYSIGKKLILSN